MYVSLHNWQSLKHAKQVAGPRRPQAVQVVKLEDFLDLQPVSHVLDMPIVQGHIHVLDMPIVHPPEPILLLRQHAPSTAISVTWLTGSAQSSESL